MEFWRALAFGAGAAISFTICRWLVTATAEGARQAWLMKYRMKRGVPVMAQVQFMAAQFGDLSGLVPSPTWAFSPDWTDQDRLKLCILFTHIFRDDFLAGRYGTPGRPNIQALHELVFLPSTELETHRRDINAIAFAFENHFDIAEVLKELK